MDKKPKTGKHIHLIGIGGSGLSAIAKVLLDRGFVVTGSDQELTQRTAELYEAGANIFKGHKASHIRGAQMVVRSSAVPRENPEVVAAQEAGIPVLRRSDLIGSLMTKNIGVAVAGTHGKTTTTGMIAHIFLEAGLDPTVIVGDTLPSMGSNGRAGQGPHFIVEADEYDHMFLGLRPRISVVTNIEYDHPDIFPSPTEYQQAFRDFVALLHDHGHLVICAEDEECVNLLRIPANARKTAYGIGYPITPLPGLDLLLAPRVHSTPEGGSRFDVELNDQRLGEIVLLLPGEHNVNNSLAAIAVALGEGIAFETIAKALATFGGMRRRFDVLGQVGNITIVDDYAHHPTEIRSTLAAARQRYGQRRLWAVWQPHTYSRLKALWAEFATSFGAADQVVVLDVFRSREREMSGLTGQALSEKIDHPSVRYAGGVAAVQDYLLGALQPDDVLILMNAGDARLIGEWVLDMLRERIGDEWLEEVGNTAVDGATSDPNHRVAKLDATVSQVQRLVAKLQQEQEGKQN